MSSGAWPHVYILHCHVNEPMLDRLAGIRGVRRPAEPEWLFGLRVSLSAATEDIEELRARSFVKIGSTYKEDPTGRTAALMAEDRVNTTMMCRMVPVLGRAVLAFIPGEEELEKLLHRRWAADRIDLGREFFWWNSEMAELAQIYRPAPPAPPPAPAVGLNPFGGADPFARGARRRRGGYLDPYAINGGR